MDKCGHTGCTCSVEEGAEYCSDHCREHGAHDDNGHGCECGHPECEGSAAG